MTLKIVKSGIYDMSNEAYHADPAPTRSLSSTYARGLINTSPMHVRHAMDNPKKSTDAMEFGSALHSIILEKADNIELINFKSFGGKEAGILRRAAIDSGKIPMLAHRKDEADIMVAALKKHPVAPKLLANGDAEKSLFWQDKTNNIWCRARIDWMPKAGNIFTDYKTCASANPADIAKSIYNFGYFQQAEWYMRGIKALGICDNPQFAFIFQESKPPYDVIVVQLDPTALALGKILNDKASAIFSCAIKSDNWHGYCGDIETIGLPYFGEKQLQDKIDMGIFDLPNDEQTAENDNTQYLQA